MITIEDLENFVGLSSELEALQIERQWLYYPVKSPQGREQTGVDNRPSDPTASAVAKIEAVDRQIEARQIEIADKLSEILTWLDTVPSQTVRSAVHWHYLQRLDWGRTCMKVYGYHSYYTCRKEVMRYFGREK